MSEIKKANFTPNRQARLFKLEKPRIARDDNRWLMSQSLSEINLTFKPSLATSE
jgi:hypothetical protein